MFTKNNETFECVNCGFDVPVHPTSSRDHCPECLYSMHVDIYPGDRANNCKGVLVPIGIVNKNSKTQIVYRCSLCHKVLMNITAPDDNKEAILELSTAVW